MTKSPSHQLDGSSKPSSAKPSTDPCDDARIDVDMVQDLDVADQDPDLVRGGNCCHSKMV
jgi:hypothetical protein